MGLLLLNSVTVPVIGFSALCLIYLCYRRLVFKPIAGIPYNKNAAYTLLGDTTEASKALNETGCIFPWLMSHVTKYNTPVYQVFMRIGQKPWVVVADFKEAQDCMLRRTKEFDRSELVTDVFIGVTPDLHINLKTNDTFKAHRNLIKDLMTPAFLNKVAAPKIYASADNLVKYWSLKAQLAQDRPFDASKDIFNFMLDSITAVTFGLDTDKNVTALATQHLAGADLPHINLPQNNHGAIEFNLPERPPMYGSLVYLMETLGGTIKSPVPRLYHWLIRQTPAYRKANGIKEAMILGELEKGIARYKSGDHVQRCALDNVLQTEMKLAKKADRKAEYKSRVIFDELLGFLFGGHDTTASTMSFGWKHLAANPRVQTLLRTHLRQAFSQAVTEGRQPTYDEITSTTIPYLDATMEEIHRKAKVFPFVFRTAMVDTQILGHAIPKGTDILFCQSGPSYDSDPFDIPDSLRTESFLSANYNIGQWDAEDLANFRPERWLKTDEKGNDVFDPAAGPIMAFALGPRGCYGRRLAYLQMRMMIVLILWNIELLHVDGELGGFERIEKLATVPRNTYLRLKVLDG